MIWLYLAAALLLAGLAAWYAYYHRRAVPRPRLSTLEIGGTPDKCVITGCTDPPIVIVRWGFYDTAQRRNWPDRPVHPLDTCCFCATHMDELWSKSSGLVALLDMHWTNYDLAEYGRLTQEPQAWGWTNEGKSAHADTGVKP